MEEQENIETSVSTEQPSASVPETTPVENAAPAEPAAQVENPNGVDDKGTQQVEKPQYTDLQKAQYSFHKQFSKQRARYEKQLADRDNQLKEMMERLERLEHPEKYAPKTRNDFQTDDEFINHLVDGKVEALLKQKLEDYQKQEEENRKQTELESKYKTRVSENVAKLYADEAARKEYQSVIDTALSEGLGDVLDQDADLSRYIMLSPLGPKIMYELASNEEAVESLFGEGVTPLERQFKIREIEARLREAPAPTAPAAPTAVQTPEPPKPVVMGQPGKTHGTPNKDIFSDTNALREFLRR